MAPSQLQEIGAWSEDLKVLMILFQNTSICLVGKAYLTVNLSNLKAVLISGRVQKYASETTSDEFLSSMQTKLQHERHTRPTVLHCQAPLSTRL